MQPIDGIPYWSAERISNCAHRYDWDHTSTGGIGRTRCRRRQARCDSKCSGLPTVSACLDSTNDRSELGHWEADQIIGANSRSSMLWLTERMTRYSIGVTMPEGYGRETMLSGLGCGLVCGLDQIPSDVLRSVTFNQGSKWPCSEIIAVGYDIKIWFGGPVRHEAEEPEREPQSSVTLVVSPRIDLSSVSQADVHHAASIIDGQCR